MPAPNRSTALSVLLSTFVVLVTATACGTGTAASSPSGGFPSSPPAASTPSPAPVAAEARVRFAILRDIRKAANGDGYVVTVDPARFLVADTADQVICRMGYACWDSYIVDNPDPTTVRIPVAVSAEVIMDVVIGGMGIDTMDHSGRSGNLTVTLNGTANDGLSGEGDNVDATVENVIGGIGSDSLTGDAADNVLTGAPGNDTLFGKGGADTFFMRDGAADSAFGGPGTDAARVDGAINSTTGVESLIP